MIKINTVLSPKLHHLYPSFDPRLQVFSTRKVDFADIKWVGFDMDHTLCKYKSGPVEKLSFKLALDNMVKIKKYPKDILDFEYDHRFPVRGLVIDKKHGTVLKLNAHRKVTRVCKGRKCLNKTEISKLYQNEVIRLSASRYEVMDTLFHLPSCSLFASFVDWQENTGFCRRMLFLFV